MHPKDNVTVTMQTSWSTDEHWTCRSIIGQAASRASNVISWGLQLQPLVPSSSNGKNTDGGSDTPWCARHQIRFQWDPAGDVISIAWSLRPKTSIHPKKKWRCWWTSLLLTSRMLSRKLIPDASLGEETKRFSSCDFTLVNTPLVTDSCCFLVPFLPLSSRIVHTNSKLLRRYWADLQNEWFGTKAVFEESPLKCMVSLLIFFFRIPRLKALILLNTGWPVSWIVPPCEVL